MNIYGIGTDIVNSNRIKLAIKNCEKRKNKVECYAKRFAAKEALFKAVGVGNKLQFKDIEIKNNPSGAPKFNIKGNSLKNLKKIFKNKKFKIYLSLSDDKPWAIASVIIFLYR